MTMIARTFSDVLLKPKYSNVPSRKDVDVSWELNCGLKLGLPIVSANMKDITGPSMCEEMHVAGGLGILHRFNNTEDAVKDFEDAMMRLQGSPLSATREYEVGVSIGVNMATDFNRAMALYDAGARVFCIDVAHGHHILVKEMLIVLNKELRNRTSDHIYIIAGNVATFEGARALGEWGADCVKVGLGPGSMCQTRSNTGVGVPQLFAIEEASKAKEHLKTKGNHIDLISDGGIKETGDIAKALVFADMVMLGSMLSGTIETPGHVYENEEGYYKVFGGSASGENKVNAGKEKQFIEGMVKTTPFRGHVRYILKKIHENLQSSCSYVGAKSLIKFKEQAEFIDISGGGRIESKI